MFLLNLQHRQVLPQHPYHDMEFIETHNLTGIIIGAATFITIGLFHPLVIKGEYYIGSKCKYLFLALGLVMLAVSLMADGILAQSLSAVVSFSSFWSIHEVEEQVKRVEKGWFPRNPKRDIKQQ